MKEHKVTKLQFSKFGGFHQSSISHWTRAGHAPTLPSIFDIASVVVKIDKNLDRKEIFMHICSLLYDEMEEKWNE